MQRAKRNRRNEQGFSRPPDVPCGFGGGFVTESACPPSGRCGWPHKTGTSLLPCRPRIRAFCIAWYFFTEDLASCRRSSNTSASSGGAVFSSSFTDFLSRESTSRPCFVNHSFICWTEFGFSRAVSCRIFAESSLWNAHQWRWPVPPAPCQAVCPGR